ncbi:MAG: RecA-family [Desulfobulbaceae bacterium]|nr:MAG: RecA-family [Desulfobulbaceae bacterium]
MNPGIEAATKAALSIGAKMATPDLSRKSDFWDVWSEQGPDGVKARITAAKTPGAKSDRQFRFISSSHLEFTAPKWLIKNYIEDQTTTSFFGAAGSMKTFVTIDMGLSISTGKDWQGNRVKKGPVLYICGEGKGGIKKRVAAWEIHNETKAPLFFVSTVAAQLLDPASLSDVEAAADEVTATHGKPVLVIIDTLNRNFGPGDENSTSDMTKFIHAIDHLKDRLQCAIAVIHHSGLADAGRGRGSSALRGAMDFEYNCDKSGETIEDQTLTLTNTKTKDHEAPMPKTFKPVLIDLGIVDEDLQPITSLVLEITEQAPAKTKGLSLANRTALEALKALAVHGDDVSETAWRSECYARGIATTDKPDAKQKAFSRARTFLLSSCLIGTRNDLYWITSSDKIEPGHPDRPGQDRTCPALSPLDEPDGQDIYLRVCPSVRSKEPELSQSDDFEEEEENAEYI